MNRYHSSFQTVGDDKDPDIIYYNASIVNNTTDDATIYNTAVQDPIIRFNETRDTAIIKDASKYQFSIVRFVMNGPNKDLPLFIPAIQTETGQTDVNLTEYGIGLTYQGLDCSGNGVIGWANTYNNIDNSGNYTTSAIDASGNGTPQTPAVAAVPGLTYVLYTPETLNPTLAPLPRPLNNANFVGDWISTTTYTGDNIVFYSSTLTYYQNKPQYNSSGVLIPNLNNAPTTVFWTSVSAELGNNQDISTRYYWVYTYDHWLGNVQTALENANYGLYSVWRKTPGASSATYTSYAGRDGSGNLLTTAWTYWNATPIISFNPTTNLFSIDLPQSYLPLAQRSQWKPTQSATQPLICLYFNTNMEGLFSNFNNQYWNQPNTSVPIGNPNPFPLAPPITITNGTYNRWSNGSLTPTFPSGFANLLIPVIFSTGANIITTTYLNGTTSTLIRMTQNYLSNSTLWSPIDSIVFTTSLLPVLNEQQAPPNQFGTKNVGQSAGVSKSAFSPTVTDISLDLSNDPSGYRKMIFYAPSAEYRMSEFQNSRADIRSIDIQIFWRNRLDNNLYPLTMFNLSSVSIKMMFRKKYALAKSEQHGQSMGSQ